MPDSPGPVRRRRSPSVNNPRQLETVSRNRQVLQNVLKDAEALDLASKRKQTAATLAPVLRLADDYVREYGERDAATGTRTTARTGLAAADAAAADEFNDLRSTLRTEYAGQPEHLETLGVAGDRAARDRDVFLDEVRTTLAAVRRAPYAEVAAGYDWPAKRLDALEASVDALEAAASGHTSAGGAHGGSTAERDAAYAAFMERMAPVRRFLGLAFRGHPHVAKRVGLTGSA